MDIDKKREFIYNLVLPEGEVVHIGVEGSQILQVKSETIEYIANSGEERVIDLKECGENWAQGHDHRCYPAPEAI